MRNIMIILTILTLSTLYGLAFARSPSPEGAYVYIISPIAGEHVSSPVLVKFGLRGMGIAPAGTNIKHTGHHHLLIDVENLPDLDKPIPADDNHIHYGKGQTEALVELPPGQHNLQLLFGDYVHIPHEPVVNSDPITITVTE